MISNLRAANLRLSEQELSRSDFELEILSAAIVVGGKKSQVFSQHLVIGRGMYLKEE
jgi:hypothetical protein